jgi:hypothetical protein
MEYMQSGEFEVDKAFYDESNDDFNHPAGCEKNITIKQRFDRAVNHYEYCFVKGRQSSINSPWDHPPDIPTLIALRNRMQAQAQLPDVIIEASIHNLLDTNPDFAALWAAGGKEEREARAIDYATRVQEALSYVHSEVAPRMQLVTEQLNKDTGFLTTGKVRYAVGVTAEDMDEAMPQETQWNKLGDVYIHCGVLTAYGLCGRYYKAGHKLELAMYNEERKKELSGIHYLILRTWRQLMEINQLNQEET